MQIQEFKFENPPEDINKRDFYGKNTPRFDVMMGILHNDLTKTQRVYYCGFHHSIETVSTYKNHKDNEICKVYTRGQILGEFFSFFLLYMTR